METKKTILDYILQTQDILLDMVHNRTTMFHDFITWYQDKNIRNIYIVGSGTSCHAGFVMRKFLEDVLKINVQVRFPQAFMEEGVLPEHTLVIGISQSGGSISTKNALEKAKQYGFYTVSMVGQPSSVLSQCAHKELMIPCGEEKAAAKTKGYGATVMMLTLLGLELAKHEHKLDDVEYTDKIQRLQKSILNINPLITYSNQWYEIHKEELLQAKRILVIGYENQYGTMLEGALKLLETVRVAVCGYECEEFMHGPYNSIDENTYIFHICQASTYKERAVHLKEYLDTITSYNYAIYNGELNIGKDIVCPISDDEYFSVFEYIIPFQCISYQLSNDKGIDATIASDPSFHQKMGSKKL